MNKNIIWVLIILLVPIALYYGLTRDKVVMPANAAGGDEIIKFSSPMCYECQELEKSMKKVFPKYSGKISLRKIDVTKRNKDVDMLMEQYEVKLVPTTIFKNQDGRVLRRIEGTMEPEVLDNCLAELVNE